MPKSTKKVAPRRKVTTKRVKTVAARNTAMSKSQWEKYCDERESFYRRHPNSQLLLAILILVFLVYFGLYLWSQSAVMGWM